jgi:hypothetical protein
MKLPIIFFYLPAHVSRKWDDFSSHFHCARTVSTDCHQTSHWTFPLFLVQKHVRGQLSASFIHMVGLGNRFGDLINCAGASFLYHSGSQSVVRESLGGSRKNISNVVFFVLSFFDKTISNLIPFTFATAYVSEKNILIYCPLTRKTTDSCLIFHVYLAFCKKAMEHRVADKYLATVGSALSDKRKFYGTPKSIPRRISLSRRLCYFCLFHSLLDTLLSASVTRIVSCMAVNILHCVINF